MESVYISGDNVMSFYLRKEVDSTMIDHHVGTLRQADVIMMRRQSATLHDVLHGYSSGLISVGVADGHGSNDVAKHLLES